MDFGQRSIFGFRHAVDDEQHAQKTETGVDEKRAARSDVRVHRAGQTRDYPNDYPVGRYGHACAHRFQLRTNKIQLQIRSPHDVRDKTQSRHFTEIRKSKSYIS